MGKEYHNDDSVTERFKDGTSVTKDSDGSVREHTKHETTVPFGFGRKVTTTYDGDGKIINSQLGWGDEDE